MSIKKYAPPKVLSFFSQAQFDIFFYIKWVANPKPYNLTYFMTFMAIAIPLTPIKYLKLIDKEDKNQ